MPFRSVIATAFAALAFGALPVLAQTPPATATMPSVPANTCAKPEFPGRLGSDARIKAFNREYTAYRDCTNKYVDATKKLANDAIAAGNTAIDDFNKFAEDIKAQSDANK